MLQRSSNNQRALVVHNNVGAAQHPPTGIQAQSGSQLISITGLSYAPRQFETGQELIMLVPRAPAAASSLIHTSVVECNHPIHNPYQSAAFYLSVLSGVFPGLLPLAKEDLRDMGYSVREVTEDTAAQNIITLQSWINGSTLLTIFGQLALILYKNMTDQSYAQLMQTWTSAIKKAAGKVGDLVPGQGDVLLSISTARNIQLIVGSSSRISAALLNMILANRDGESRLNKVCNYLADLQHTQTIRTTHF